MVVFCGHGIVALSRGRSKSKRNKKKILFNRTESKNYIPGNAMAVYSSFWFLRQRIFFPLTHAVRVLIKLPLFYDGRTNKTYWNLNGEISRIFLPHHFRRRLKNVLPDRVLTIIHETSTCRFGRPNFSPITFFGERVSRVFIKRLIFAGRYTHNIKFGCFSFASIFQIYRWIDMGVRYYT